MPPEASRPRGQGAIIIAQQPPIVAMLGVRGNLASSETRDIFPVHAKTGCVTLLSGRAVGRISGGLCCQCPLAERHGAYTGESPGSVSSWLAEGLEPQLPEPSFRQPLKSLAKKVGLRCFDSRDQGPAEA